MKNSNVYNHFEVHKGFHQGVIGYKTWLWKLHELLEREPKKQPALEVIHELS